MSCRFDKNIIQKYVDNSIDPLELIILKEHIAVCGDCKFELELMSRLEDSLYQYFDGMPEHEHLDAFSLEVLDKCYEQAGSGGYKKGIAKAWEINKMVVSNASKYTSYLPGSRLAAACAKKAGSSMNKALKGYVKNSFRKLITNAIK